MTTPARPDIYQQFKEHFNEPVIVSFEIGRVIGYGEDDYDCYLILQMPNGHRTWADKDGIMRTTAVGGYTYLDRLQGQSPVTTPEGKYWDDFIRLDNFLALNGAPKVASFIEEFRSSPEPVEDDNT